MTEDEIYLPEKVMMFAPCESNGKTHFVFITPSKKHLEDFLSDLKGSENHLEELRRTNFEKSRLSNNLYWTTFDLPNGTKFPSENTKVLEIEGKMFEWECKHELNEKIRDFVYSYESRLEKINNILHKETIDKIMEKYTHSREFTLPYLKDVLKRKRVNLDCSNISGDSMPSGVQNAIPCYRENFEAINSLLDEGQMELFENMPEELISLYEIFMQAKKGELHYLAKEDLLGPVVQHEAMKKNLAYLQDWEEHVMMDLKNLEKYVKTGKCERYDALKVLGKMFMSHMN